MLAHAMSAASFRLDDKIRACSSRGTLTGVFGNEQPFYLSSAIDGVDGKLELLLRVRGRGGLELCKVCFKSCGPFDFGGLL